MSSACPDQDLFRLAWERLGATSHPARTAEAPHHRPPVPGTCSKALRGPLPARGGASTLRSSGHVHTCQIRPIPVPELPDRLICRDPGRYEKSGLAACGKTHAAFDRRSIPPEPLRCTALCVAFRSKYTWYSSLTRLVSRAHHRSRRSPGFHHRRLAFYRRRLRTTVSRSMSWTRTSSSRSSRQSRRLTSSPTR